MPKKYKAKDRFWKSAELRGPGRSEFGHSRGQGWGPPDPEGWREEDRDEHRMGVPGRGQHGRFDRREETPGSAYQSESQYGYDRLRGYREQAWDERTRGRTGGFEKEAWIEPGPYTGAGPQGYRRPDERIYEEVCERLTRHGQVDAGQIQVRVNNGEVTLVGSIADRRQKRLAEDAIESVAGVVDIHNQLQIRKSGGETFHVGGTGPETKQTPGEQDRSGLFRGE